MFRSTHILSGDTLYERPPQTIREFQTALDRLRVRQAAFAALDAGERAALLEAFAGRLEAAKGRLARMICEEVGRCLRECEAELAKSVELVRHCARTAPALLSPQTVPTPAARSEIHFAPLGIVFAVMPWNYPVWQILRFAVPALCAGNACAVKPAPSVARISATLFDTVSDSLPLIPAWLAHGDVEHAIAAADAFAFTGSAATGRKLAAAAAGRLKKSVLELGGSNPFIVLPDADLQQAARDACYSRFRDAGQSCNAAKRIILVGETAEPFIRLFLAECAKLKSGDPFDPATTLAPMHRADLREKLHMQVQDAVAHGAILLCGGYLPEGKGTFYPATVLDRVPPGCRAYREELFGPAAAILRARDPQHAVALANDNPYGLGASIYTADERAARHYAALLQTGAVYVNRHTSSDLRLPFGGIKDSGYGRELSEFGLYEFANIKTYRQNQP
ncbi:Succinate semialdehyde dehydrogenase [NAD(P)+] Sad [Kingella potus]|uniref:Succinate semialdehyde dehydrogenase [NAD(P)+] Sad n=1 Tax=Kingella potus TaxID=265175 RepID=A0A377R3I2_9NEIS|nr:aldehyde dehydrogenase family protein [Kingella potus]STR02774.1 Succinate semialdehyde dehydrogenase [NAD(P)+] Sad [Kingella potus]